MICILKIENGEVKGWLMAQDTVDALNKMPIGDEHQPLIRYLAEAEAPFPPGKHELPTGHVLLVE